MQLTTFVNNYNNVIILKTCYDLTVGISCSSLFSVYLFRFQLHLLFVFAVTMIMVNKDYQTI